MDQPITDHQSRDDEPLSSQFHRRKFNFPQIKWFYIISLFVLVVGMAVAILGLQQKQDVRSKAAELDPHAVAVIPFQEDAKRGLVWAGLRAGKENGLCGHLYEAVDKAGQVTGCTHGPDPAPYGVDATKSVEPLTAGDVSAPVVAQTVACDGDGTSGYRVQTIYVHASDVADRYDAFATSFPEYAQVADKVFDESAAQTGGSRHIRFVTDSACNLVVNREVVSPTGDDSIGNLVTELKNKGYTRTDRKYMVWLDKPGYCGQGYIQPDDTPGQTNRNNSGPTFSSIGSGCWGGTAEAHEIMHNLGGVQLSAPHTSKDWHCTDSYDRMCYQAVPSGSPIVITIACTSLSEKYHFDCNKDDYYSTNPPAGSYLATHWNTATSRFLIGTNISLPTATPTSPVLSPTLSAPTLTPTPSSDTDAPIITISSPTEGTVIGSRVTVSATATDNVGVVNMQVYIDGILRTTVTTGTISTSWNSRKASLGTHSITVKASDAAGNTASATVVVYK